MPVGGSLAMGYLLYRYFPNARGSGVPQTKAALFAHNGYISLRTVLGKFFCTATTLACGIPLLCSPWNDIEHLFRPGQDYFVAADGKQMAGEIDFLLGDQRARAQMAANGLETIRQRHTCAHRAAQLIEICQELRG